MIVIVVHTILGIVEEDKSMGSLEDLGRVTRVQ